VGKTQEQNIMNSIVSDRTVRFAIAAERLLRHAPNPEFVGDGQSVNILSGGPPDPADFQAICSVCEKTDLDIVYLEFRPGRESQGPTGLTIIAKRDGLLNFWPQCTLWAPKDGGPLLIVPKDDIAICIGYDGLALTWMERPAGSLANGIDRARTRLRFAERSVTAEQVTRVREEGDRAAA
jgi:hypothetical protein